MIALSDASPDASRRTPHTVDLTEAMSAVHLILNPESSAEEKETSRCCFLVFIYEQIDAMLKRCVTQCHSRSSTPLFPSKGSPSPTVHVQTKMAEPAFMCGDVNVSQCADGTRPRRRVQLFSPDNGGLQRKPKNGGSEVFSAHCVRPKPLSTSDPLCGDRVVTTSADNMTSSLALTVSSQTGGKLGPSAFKPLSFSTPVHKGHRSATLGDFVPVVYQKKRSCGDKNITSYSLTGSGEESMDGLNHELASLSVGSWASGNESVMLLEGGASERVNSHQKGGSHVTGTQACIPHGTKAKDSAPRKPSRRITPTAVCAKPQRLDFKQQAVFIAESAKNEPSLAEERQRLKEKKAQLSFCTDNQTLTGRISTVGPPKVVQSRGGGEENVLPLPTLVTHKHQLQEISLAFARLIDGGKTQDPMLDLQLLVQLLCCQIREGAEAEPDSVLCTAHNAVYFAVAVLCESQVLLWVLDHSVRRLLSDNERLKIFNIQLAERLAVTEDVSSYSSARHNISSVSFQADTDNGSNFPSDKSFIIFKKQRDLFYEIKRDWDKNHSLAGWNFTNNCSDRLRYLLNYGGDLSNYVHLCRLFANQLVLSCLQDGTATETDEESIMLLSQLKLSQPEKYKRLRERFVKPSLHSVHSARINSFSGQEIFFKLVIDVANDAMFTQHLTDVLSLKLLSINNTDVSGYDLDSDGPSLLSNSILTSRLVAKFLGYVHFLPYRSNERRIAALDEQYRLLRAGMSPPLDISTLVTEAMVAGRCVLLIPWLVAYLSQVDPHTLSLPYYTRLLSTLRDYLTQLKHNMLSHSLSACMLQYVSLTWLFTVLHLDSFSSDSSCIYGGPATSSLDRIATVDLRLLHDYSDSLKSVKQVLVDHLMDMRSKVSEPRKITPLTAAVNIEQTTSKQEEVHQALEDNFFHNQPPSLRRTVSFLSERLSSSYIKDFRSSTLTSSLASHKLFLFQCTKNIDSNSDVNLILAPLVAARSQELCIQLHKQLLSGVDAFFEQRVQHILELLLPSDTKNYVFSICATSISRQGLARMKKWLKANLTLEYLMGELKQAVTKYSRSGGGGLVPTPSTTFSKAPTHNNKLASPSQTLLNVQECVAELTANEKSSISESVLGDMLEEVKKCLTQRQDIELITVKSLCKLMLQLLVLVVDRQPEMITDHLLKCYQRLWQIDNLAQVWRELTAVVPAFQLAKSMNIEECVYDYILHSQGLSLEH